MLTNAISQAELKTTPLFSALDTEQLQRVVNSSQQRCLTEGQSLFKCKQEAKRFFLLRSGSIRLFLSTPGGNEKVVYIVRPGEIFAEAVTFMHRCAYPINADALRDSELVAFSIPVYRDILHESTDTCFRLMEHMGHWLKRQLNDINALTLQNASLRFSNFLLQQLPPGQQHNIPIMLPVPKHVLASQLSIKPESLSRILRNMQDSGLIRVDGNVIWIDDAKALAIQTVMMED